MEGSWNIANAVRGYVASVKGGEFPDLEHSF
jgi:ketopantoate hydroxymethyltransferase